MPETITNRETLRHIMPAMLKHEGTWEGTYTHLALDGSIIDRHAARIECEFPNNGPYFYIQRNHFSWPSGQEFQTKLPAVLRDQKLWWDTDTFIGSAWETDHGLIMLNLDRKDEPGANFFELIALGQTGEHRSRTWHWFKDGRLYKRTLCDERRVPS